MVTTPKPILLLGANAGLAQRLAWCSAMLGRAKLLLTFAVACAPASKPPSSLQAEGDGAAFHEVDPSQPVPKVFADKLRLAMDLLQTTAIQPQTELQGKIAGATLDRIKDGSVQLDTLTGALPQDLYHMCRDLHMDSCTAPLSEPWTFGADAALRRRILANYAGYMWGNRIYLTIRDASEISEVASTLVHEVVHVLHRSECNYYRDQKQQVVDDRKGFVEEYRSFIAECVFQLGKAATPQSCHKFAEGQVTTGYKFKIKITDIVGGRREHALAELIFNQSDGHKIVAERSRWPRSFAECR